MKSGVQNYAWGKKGTDSLVAKIYQKQGNVVDEEKHYAELWMGSHENCPSKIIVNNHPLDLSSHLQNNLPFLFKVLSIQIPLSIQVHPDKAFAEVLNQKYPNIYKDNNHKPEMAIAISDKFCLLYQFVGIHDLIEILFHFSEIFNFPDIINVIKLLNKDYEIYKKMMQDNSSSIDDYLSKIKELYKLFFVCLLDMDQEMVGVIINNLLGLCNVESTNLFIQKKKNLINLLFKQFNYDRGLIYALFMNYLELNYGDALFIGANEPHAYVYGECIECMANSDNTIRLGLTPKLVDIENFKKMFQIDIFNDSLQKNIIKSTCKKQNYFKFDNIKDFSIINLNLNSNENLPILKLKESGILFLLKGKILVKIEKGQQLELNFFDKIFIEAGYEIFICCIEKSEIYIATSQL